QVMERAQLHRLDAVVVVGLAREDHDLARPARLADPAEGLEPAEPWHAKVEQDDVERLLCQALEGLLAAPDALGVVTRAGEPFPHDEADLLVVVHHEHAHGPARGGRPVLASHDSAGSQNVTVVPCPKPGLDTSIRPSCCSMSDWHTARPSPTPLP